MALGPKVLFVDEGPPWLVELRARIAADYEVAAVETGPQALQVLESEPIAVLITDSRLASVQDRRFGQSLKHQHAALPRIVLADRPELELAITERNGNRVDAALPKPCVVEELFAIIERLLGEATVRDAIIPAHSSSSVSMRTDRTESDQRDKSTVDRETLPDPFDSASGDDS